LQEKEIVLANAHLVGHDKKEEVSDLEKAVAELTAEKKQLGEHLHQTSESLTALTKKATIFCFALLVVFFAFFPLIDVLGFL